MFRPKYPTAPAPTGAAAHVVTPTAVETGAAVESTGCGWQHPALSPARVPATPTAAARVRLTSGSLALLVGGGTAAVLVVGTVLVSMLLAVAITAASLAVCALVVRSLLNGQHQR